MLRSLVVCVLIGGMALPAQAQYALRADRAGAGHAPMAGGDYTLQGAAGQPAVSIVGTDPYLGAGFWYAVRNATVSLPVELAAFEAVREAERAVLTWTTASETNNVGFEVERNVEGAWETVTFLSGAGTTNQPQTYRYTDAGLPYTAETVAYRLKQIDTDGTVAHSDEVEIKRGTPRQVTLHPNAPNPFRTQTILRYALPQAGPVRLGVYDLMGRRVALLVDEEQSAGRREVVFHAQRLASGVYFVRLVAGAHTATQKLTVLR